MNKAVVVNLVINVYGLYGPIKLVVLEKIVSSFNKIAHYLIGSFLKNIEIYSNYKRDLDSIRYV